MKNENEIQILLLRTDSANRGGIQHVADYLISLIRENTEYSLTVITYDTTNKLEFFRKVRNALTQVDVVIAMHLSLQQALIRSNVPCIQFVHGIELYHHLRVTTKYLLSQADILFCSTNHVRNQLGNFTNKSQILHQSLYPSPLTSNQSEFELNKTGKGVLLVSRLSKSDRYKGIDEVLKIYHSESGESLPKLTIIGDGDDRPYLEEIVQKNAHSDKVTFTGLLSDEALRDEYKRAAGFILLSEREGQGLVFIEALSYGLPVIALKNTVAEELVTHGEDGFLADKHDSEKIKEYLVRVVRSEEMKKNAFRKFKSLRIAELFDEKVLKTVERCVD